MGTLLHWAEASAIAVGVIGLCGFILWFERVPHPLMQECIDRATEDPDV